ncbi:cation transporter [Maribacter litopenaei]|uniref:Cation transporter n=1 Tax=Maribacter litopenaei TaxID=2976127 RepID=A0ABY5Y6T4_9FLAO|nr:heavy metal-associated domain-containing protein [Maribacter litopenaei]UWX54733.1 cation transporter [Maribacter litopenaei]
MKLFLTFTALFFVSTLSSAQEGPTEAEKITSVLIEVEGMACQEGCADKISSNLNGTPGITSAEVSYVKKEAIVKFNPNIISLSDIKSIITNTKVKEYTYTIGKTTIKEK